MGLSDCIFELSEIDDAYLGALEEALCSNDDNWFDRYERYESPCEELEANKTICEND